MVKFRKINNSVKQAVRRMIHLPDFAGYVFIVGAQKAGTTALFSYLQNHPMIVCGDTKELSFFSDDNLYYKGRGYYRSLFPAKPLQGYALDATPEYLFNALSAERIKQFAPDARIVILLREPVSRAFSAFNMYCQLMSSRWFIRNLRASKNEDSDFFLQMIDGRTAVNLEHFLDTEINIIQGKLISAEPSLIRRGIYAPQISRYIQQFGAEKVLVLFSDELRNHADIIVRRVVGFLGLEPIVDRQYHPVHVRKYVVDQSGKNMIAKKTAQIFGEDKIELQKLLNFKIPW